MNTTKLKKYFEDFRFEVKEQETDENKIRWELIYTSDLGNKVSFILSCDVDAKSVEQSLYFIWRDFNVKEYADKDWSKTIQKDEDVWMKLTEEDLIEDGYEIKNVLEGLYVGFPDDLDSITDEGKLYPYYFKNVQDCKGIIICHELIVAAENKSKAIEYFRSVFPVERRLTFDSIGRINVKQAKEIMATYDDSWPKIFIKR